LPKRKDRPPHPSYLAEMLLVILIAALLAAIIASI
jgi:hypothetical protein